MYINIYIAGVVFVLHLTNQPRLDPGYHIPKTLPHVSTEIGEVPEHRARIKL